MSFIMVLSFRLFSFLRPHPDAAVAFAIGLAAHPCPTLACQGLASAELQRPVCGQPTSDQFDASHRQEFKLKAPSRLCRRRVVSVRHLCCSHNAAIASCTRLPSRRRASLPKREGWYGAASNRSEERRGGK